MDRAQRTRQRLQDTAIRLFAERGFDHVTVEEVANAAGVSHMTFFRHFPTKEAVVLDDPYDPIIGEAVAAKGGERLPIVQQTLLGVLEAWRSSGAPSDESVRMRLRLAAGHPALRARVWENNRRTEEAIVEALTSSGASRLEARVAAGAVMGALTAALLDWAENEDGEGLDGRIVRVLGVLGADDLMEVGP